MPTITTHASRRQSDGAADPLSAPGRIAAAGEPVLDAERLDVFHVAVEFQAIATGLAAKAGSVLLDGPRQSRGVRGHPLSIAYLLRARGMAGYVEHGSSRKLIVRIVQMLSRLAARTR
jgi:hypothetical protein